MNTATRSRGGKIWLIVLAVVAVIAVGVFMGFKREPYTTWKEDESKLLLNKHGKLLALSLFYQKQLPQMRQQVWRTWKDKEPTFGNQTEHLLFINDASNITTSQFNQLLAWVAQGNHVVLSIQAYQVDQPDDEAQ